ncbi:glycosyltransferase family 2 protein [Demequina sp. NBRC 110051]|uniref:glycosyltransferase family 2 protein n=1 Tax=Demequina sp. NBRC 110051 TaxID=1570340 RepID=UPI0013565E3E|nr:glycosyltransferase [Demequina sp. NBRC 110051]
MNDLDARDIVSPTLYSGHDERVWFGGGKFHRLAGFTRHFHSAPRDRYRQVNFLTGAAMMMRLGRWRELGGFREPLFLYWEDTDLCIRASRTGSRLFVVRDARVWHRTGGSSRRGEIEGKSRVWYYFLARNRLVVCAPYALRSPMFFVTGLSASLGLAFKALREPNDRFAKLAWLIRGSWDGLRAQNDAQLRTLTDWRAAQLGLEHQTRASSSDMPHHSASSVVRHAFLADRVVSE